MHQNVYISLRSDLIELQMEVCDPEGVKDACQEDDDYPGVEDKPGYQEAARLPVQSANTKRVTERGEDRKQEQHAPIEEVIKVLSEGFFRVCDGGHCEGEAGDEVSEVHHPEALEDPPRGCEHSRVELEAVRAQQILACPSDILHHSPAQSYHCQII